MTREEIFRERYERELAAEAAKRLAEEEAAIWAAHDEAKTKEFFRREEP